MGLNALLKTASVVLVVAACCAGAAAQVSTLSGNVTLKRADGTQTPVAGAVVDIYRVDIAQKFETLTNARGDYTRAGLPFVGTYAVAASAPGAAPDFKINIRVTQTNGVNFVLTPGDGHRLTLDEIKGSAASTANAPRESEGDKLKRAEVEKENARIEAENRKIVASNEAVSRAFAAGNEALNASAALAADAQVRKLDEAIAAYDEGLAVRADEPALLTNKSEALRRRGALRFNAAIKANRGVDAAKAEAGPDWRAAGELAAKALAVLKSAAPSDAAQQAAHAANLRAAQSTRALAMRLVATKVDQTQAQAAFDAYRELIASETDPAKKLSLRFEAAKIWYDVADLARAATELRKVLADAPSNLDAHLYLGLSLASTNNKANYAEAIKHLQLFIDRAPDTHPMKADAKAMLDYLRSP
jgi:tetratricopeptide (TPR) repeat protein